VLLGIAFLVPAALATLAVDVLSPFGVLEWLATLLLAIGLISAPWRERRPWGPSRTGLVALVALFLIRFAGGGYSPHARLEVLPRGHETRVVDRLFEERDAAILGARLFTWTGTFAAPEFPTLAPLLVTAYDDMELELGHRLGTTLPSTTFGHDTGDAFDTFIIEPDGEPRGTVIFLHGYAGNFVLYCWQIAVAARAANMRTLCPSTEFAGRWWTVHSERIVRAALAYSARQDDIVVLAGLSAGGFGASRLAPELHGTIDGLVLLSGTDPEAPDPLVPTLLVHGDHDGMMPIDEARTYRDAHPDRTTLHEMPGTHFLLIEQRANVRAEITRFLFDRQRESSRRSGDARPR